MLRDLARLKECVCHRSPTYPSNSKAAACEITRDGFEIQVSGQAQKADG
jgi:hypothetical protein